MVITCILPTADRIAFTAEAVSYFNSQTYPYVDLRILVFDTSTQPFRSPAVSDAGKLARSVHHWESRLHNDTIGAIRNRANTLALMMWPETDLLAHWDSDDYYGPDRLTLQSSLLAASGKSISGFSTAKFTNGSSWWKYTGTQGYALGASLLYTPSWWLAHPFPNQQIGEDTMWTRDAALADQLLRTEACFDLTPDYTSQDLLVVRCHAGNTSKKSPGQDWLSLT